MGKNNDLFNAAKRGDLAAVQKWLAKGAAAARREAGSYQCQYY
jgi:hypothetical protein